MHRLGGFDRIHSVYRYAMSFGAKGFDEIGYLIPCLTGVAAKVNYVSTVIGKPQRLLQNII